MASRKFKVGIVGCGGIAGLCHVPGWQAHPDVEIAAVCDVDKARAAALAQKAGAKSVFSDFRKLARLKELDAVDVCAPNRVHTPAVLAALEAGKHVICEKPLAVTVREVAAMGQLARRKKRKLMTAQNCRYHPMAVAIKRFVDDGAIGKPIHARVYSMRRNLLPGAPGFIDRALSGGGPCMDIGVHSLDLALHFMGFPKPVRVTGTSKLNFAKGHDIPGGWGEWDRKLFSVEDFAAGFVHFESGSTLVLETSWLNHQEEDERMEDIIFGSAGSIYWPSGKYSSARRRVLYNAQLKEPQGLRPGHTAELFDFYDCVTQNKPSPVPWEETIKVIAILEGIYRSEKLKREIRLRL